MKPGKIIVNIHAQIFDHICADISENDTDQIAEKIGKKTGSNNYKTYIF